MDEESLMEVIGEEEELLEDDDAADTETETTPAPESTTTATPVAVPVAAVGQGDPPQPERRTLTGQFRHLMSTHDDELTSLLVTRSQLLQLFGQHRAFRALFADAGADILDEAYDDDDDPYGRAHRSRRRAHRRSSEIWPKIPSEKGRELMESGTFGLHERDQCRYKRKKKLAARLMRRELGQVSPGRKGLCRNLISQSLIPQSQADSVIHYDNRCYSGQFSDDGNFFFSCSQDFKVRMYDTSNPYSWRYYKTVKYPYGQWTITDASLSPDNKFLAYSSIRSTVCLANTDPEPSDPYLLDFSDTGARPAGRHGRGGHFGIWSLRFSGDGREIVAGTSDQSVYVYDLETRQSILRIPGHDDDVNAVCYGDQSSPHILYSGSDDTTLKVWDRRSLGDSREAGVFLGHTEGITYVDSKGDGRYVISNGKDQTMKLWDLRKMHSTEEAARSTNRVHGTGFDYRFQVYNEQDHDAHPNDCSLVTFRGHSVLKTLIRCHFSPPGSTDSRYVYSGSEDGKVWIYNMDATVAGTLDVQSSTQHTRPRTGEEEYDMAGLYEDRRGGTDWKTCVRDAAWHPNAPVIAGESFCKVNELGRWLTYTATSWNGYGMSHGTCTVHTWNDGLDVDEGEPAMGYRVDAQLRQQRFEEPAEEEGPRRSARAAAGRGFRRG